MRHLIPLFAVAASILSSAPVHADIGDQLFKLLASDGEFGDQFGQSISINNGVVAIGAHFSNNNGTDSGSAYLFNASTGVQFAKLLPSKGSQGDFFGWSIAIDNGIVAVGAPGGDDNGTDSGFAYLFNASTGDQIAKVLPSDGAANDVFGRSIAIGNGIVAVGSRWDDDNGTNSGSAYLFDASTGAQTAKILPSDGEAFDLFGNSIAIDNGIVAIGARWDDDNGGSSGSAYLFNASTGEQITKLLPSDGAGLDEFGYSIAIHNSIVAIGALGDDDNGSASGSAYLFDVSTGTQIAKLLPSDGAASDWFGYFIAINKGIVAVGARGDDDNGSDSGSAYLFDASTGVQIAKLLPSDGAAFDRFGWSIAIDAGKVAVGAILDNDNGFQAGSAYLFDAGSSNRTTAPLTDFSINTGVLLDGVLTDLETSDDSYIHTRSGFGETLVDLHNMEMSILAEAPGLGPTTIDLTIESRIDEPAGLAQIRMKNYNTTNFDIVGSYSIGNTDAVEVLAGLDASKYYNTNNGRMRVKIKHLVFVPFLAFTFESFIDQVEIVVE